MTYNEDIEIEIDGAEFAAYVQFDYEAPPPAILGRAPEDCEAPDPGYFEIVNLDVHGVDFMPLVEADSELYESIQERCMKLV